ncbi:site-specific integrase [Stappia indica]|uniref:site-specific integrase n=1 Tax=Stappia indica TaxID=538381 RepID=UPI0024494E70|nr:site-specific integrase [Stappia indica]
MRPPQPHSSPPRPPARSILPDSWNAEPRKGSPVPHRPFSDIGRAALRGHWMKARKRAGLADGKHVVPHILRHTCASRLVQGKVDLRLVQEWMGHKTMQMTMRYAHLAPMDLEACLPALERA